MNALPTNGDSEQVRRTSRRDPGSYVAHGINCGELSKEPPIRFNMIIKKTVFHCLRIRPALRISTRFGCFKSFRGSVPASSIKSAQFFKVGLHWIEFVTHNPSPGRRNSENTTRPFFGVPGPLPAWGEGAERLRLHLSSHSLYLQMASDPTGEGLSSTRLPSTQPRSDARRWPSLLHLLRTDRPPTAGSTDTACA